MKVCHDYVEGVQLYLSDSLSTLKVCLLCLFF